MVETVRITPDKLHLFAERPSVTSPFVGEGKEVCFVSEVDAGCLVEPMGWAEDVLGWTEEVLIDWMAEFVNDGE